MSQVTLNAKILHRLSVVTKHRHEIYNKVRQSKIRTKSNTTSSNGELQSNNRKSDKRIESIKNGRRKSEFESDKTKDNKRVGNSSKDQSEELFIEKDNSLGIETSVIDIENDKVIEASKRYWSEYHVRQKIYEGLLPWNEHLDTLDVPNKMMASSRSVILDVLNSIQFDVDNMIKRSNINHSELIRLVEGINNPPLFQADWYKCSNIMSRPINNKYRYIANFDMKQFFDVYEKKNLADCVSEDDHAIHGVQELLRLKLNQTRFSNLAKLTMGTIESYYYSSHHLRYGYSSFSLGTCLPLYVLTLLLQRFDDLPFFDRVFDMEFNLDKSCSTQVPILWYCILNLMTQRVFGNVNDEECGIALITWLRWAQSSLDQEHLDTKGDMLKIIKILHDKIKIKEVIQYSDQGTPISITTLPADDKEVWANGELSDLLLVKESLKVKVPEYIKYFERIMQLKIENVQDFRRIRIAISVICNPGNFKKTSPVLDLPKSIEARIHKPVAYPRIKKTIEGIGPMEFYWDNDTMLGRYANELFTHKDQVFDKIKDVNFTQSFWDKLTNNSSGRKVEVTEANKVFKNLSGQRLIQGLLQTEEYYDPVLYMETFSELGMIGIREQNDRRIRCIEVISNVIQMLMQLGLIVGEALAKVSLDIASGKQVGDIRDMLLQLKSSGDTMSYLESLDVSGMDASKQEPLLWVAYQFLLYVVKYLPNQQYFWAVEKDVDVIEYNEQGVCINKSRQHINALTVFVCTVMGISRSTDFLLIDKMFYDRVIVNGMMFWSGRFDTGSDHNLTLKPLLTVVNRDYNNAHIDDRVIRINTISGDDIFSVKNGKEDAILKESEVMIKALNQVGFIASPELSKYTGVFLQQIAAFGIVIPLPARLSLFTAERGDGRERNIFAQMDEFHSILIELAARSYVPEHWVSIFLGMWNVTRNIRYKIGNSNIMPLYKNKQVCTRYMRKEDRIYGDKNVVNIIIPYITVFLSEWISLPLRHMKTKYGQIPNSSHLQPRGDIANVIMRRLMLSPNIRSEKIARLYKKKSDELNEIYMNLTGKKLEILDYTQFRIDQFDMIDFDVYCTLEIDFAKYMLSLNRETLLESSRVKEEILVDIDNLSKKLRAQLPMDKVNKSIQSYNLLRSVGTFIPRGIVYGYSPEQRIKNAIIKPSESMKERQYIDAMLIQKLMKFKNQVFREKNEGVFAVRIVHIDGSEKSIDYHMNAICPIMPSSQTLSETANILQYSMLATRRKPSMGTFHGRLESSMWKNIQIELILEIGVKIYRKKPALMNAFFEAVQIPLELRPSLLQLIQTSYKEGLSTYISIIQPRRYFMIGTHVEFFRNHFQVRVPKVFNNEIYQFGSIIARDYFLTYGHMLEGADIIVHVLDETAFHIKHPNLLN
nr:MAG: RNA-dependent RNA polymerase [Wufeng shrew reo-like virus 1]